MNKFESYSFDVIYVNNIQDSKPWIHRRRTSINDRVSIWRKETAKTWCPACFIAPASISFHMRPDPICDLQSRAHLPHHSAPARYLPIPGWLESTNPMGSFHCEFLDGLVWRSFLSKMGTLLPLHSRSYIEPLVLKSQADYGSRISQSLNLSISRNSRILRILHILSLFTLFC